MQIETNRRILFRSLVPALAACMLLSLGSSSPARGNTVLGQTGSMHVVVDGSMVPSGTTLLSPSVLETRSQPARVLLAQGQVLGLEKETRAHLETTPWGDIEVVVDGGSVAAQNAAGDVVTAFANQRLVFVQAAAQTDQGGGSGSPPPVLATNGCSVNAEGGCSANGGSCTGRCECVKTDPATGACEQCSCVAAAEIPSKGGLSTKAKIGIGVAAGVGLILLIDELDNNDEPAASPVN